MFESYSNDYVLLNKLNSSREDWKIKVRVCRLWDVRDYKDREKIISTEMVIADEEGNYMHAVIWHKFVIKYKDFLNEGRVYYMKNFSVMSNKAKYKVVSKCAFMISFFQATYLKLLDGNYDYIPLHIFEFVSFGELKSRVRNDFPLTDIVGIVVSIGNVEEKNVNGSPVNTLVIELQDSECQIIQLTLWDCYVDEFTKKLESISGCGVVIITSTIVKSFVGRINLSTSNSSKIYFDLSLPEVDQLKEKMMCSDGASKPVIRIIEPGENRVVAITDFDAICSVPELLASIHGERDKDVLHCLAQIKCVRIRNGWYYTSCKCKKKLELIDGGFWCPQCKKNVKYPINRMRLELSVECCESSVVFTLFDKVAERMVGMSVDQLISLSQSSEDVDDAFLPEKLSKLAGSSYLFDVKLGTYAKSGGVHFFNVIGVLDKSSDCDDVDLKNATLNNNEESMLLFDCSKAAEEIATHLDGKKKTDVEYDDILSKEQEKSHTQPSYVSKQSEDQEETY
ncbi:hypothetical protein REPUB_Repub05bG0055100 [Reevesia pubescens]